MSLLRVTFTALTVFVALGARPVLAQQDPFEIEKEEKASTEAPSGPGGEVATGFSITAFFGTDNDGKEVNPYKDGDNWADLEKAKGSLTDDDALRAVEGSNELTMQKELASEKARAERRARYQELREERSGKTDKLDEFEERLNK